MQKIVRKRIVFYGEVQGVGFRFRARNAADRVGATGWVRNEYDGSVVMEIQGTELMIDEVIRMIQQGRFIEISDMEAEKIPLIEDERRFRTEWY